jgi:hypothetical protein
MQGQGKVTGTNQLLSQSNLRVKVAWRDPASSAVSRYCVLAFFLSRQYVPEQNPSMSKPVSKLR